MTQTLNVTVPIPDTHVLVAKDEYNELLSYSLDPVWEKELKRKLKMSSDDTIKDRLLFNPKFEKLLKQQGIAHYPDGSLNRWRFNARKMNKFIEEHFEEIHGKEINMNDKAFLIAGMMFNAVFFLLMLSVVITKAAFALSGMTTYVFFEYVYYAEKD